MQRWNLLGRNRLGVSNCRREQIGPSSNWKKPELDGDPFDNKMAVANSPTATLFGMIRQSCQDPTVELPPNRTQDPLFSVLQTNIPMMPCNTALDVSGSLGDQLQHQLIRLTRH
jgi:hypothetical protein